MTRARAPETIRLVLARALARLKKGPDPTRVWTGESEEHREGCRAEATRQATWRSTWVQDDLEAVLAYLEGRLTVADLETGREKLMDGVPRKVEGSRPNAATGRALYPRVKAYLALLDSPIPSTYDALNELWESMTKEERETLDKVPWRRSGRLL